MNHRKYLPSMADLIDRLSILQLKEVHIPEHKSEYADEIKLILHDLDLLLKSEVDGRKSKPVQLDAKTVRAIVVLAQYNAHIWQNEAEARKGGEGNLKFTHSINGVRNAAKNKIQELVGGRKDYKIDCLAAEFSKWEPSW